MNAYAKKSKVLILMIFVMIATLAMPIMASAAPEDNLTVEFRYTPGEEYTIPNTYTFAGRTFRLLSQAEPVLESQMPITRSYYYRLAGNLTEADMQQLQLNSDAKLSFTPVTVERDREIVRTDKITGLRNNDVVELSPSGFKDFPITADEKSKGIVKRDPMELASVEYNIESYEFDTLPATYSADLVYKGLEIYQTIEYNNVEATYETTKQEGTVDQYVIVAVYEPTDLVEPAPTPNPVTPAGPTTPTTPTETPVETPVETVEIPGLDTPMAAQSNNPVQEIRDGNVPLGNTNVQVAWSLLSLILAVVAVCVAIFALLQTYLNRRSYAEIADGKRRPRIGLYLLTFAIGIATLAVWLYVDAVSLNNPYVWINENTPIVGIMLAVAVITFIIARIRNIGSYRASYEEMV